MPPNDKKIQSPQWLIDQVDKNPNPNPVLADLNQLVKDQERLTSDQRSELDLYLCSDYESIRKKLTEVRSWIESILIKPEWFKSLLRAPNQFSNEAVSISRLSKNEKVPSQIMNRLHLLSAGTFQEFEDNINEIRNLIQQADIALKNELPLVKNKEEDSSTHQEIFGLINELTKSGLLNNQEKTEVLKIIEDSVHLDEAALKQSVFSYLKSLLSEIPNFLLPESLRLNAASKVISPSASKKVDTGTVASKRIRSMLSHDRVMFRDSKMTLNTEKTNEDRVLTPKISQELDILKWNELLSEKLPKNIEKTNEDQALIPKIYQELAILRQSELLNKEEISDLLGLLLGCDKIDDTVLESLFFTFSDSLKGLFEGGLVGFQFTLKKLECFNAFKEALTSASKKSEEPIQPEQTQGLNPESQEAAILTDSNDILSQYDEFVLFRVKKAELKLHIQNLSQHFKISIKELSKKLNIDYQRLYNMSKENIVNIRIVELKILCSFQNLGGMFTVQPGELADINQPISGTDKKKKVPAPKKARKPARKPRAKVSVSTKKRRAKESVK